MKKNTEDRSNHESLLGLLLVMKLSGLKPRDALPDDLWLLAI